MQNMKSALSPDHGSTDELLPGPRYRRRCAVDSQEPLRRHMIRDNATELEKAAAKVRHECPPDNIQKAEEMLIAELDQGPLGA